MMTNSRVKPVAMPNGLIKPFRYNSAPVQETILTLEQIKTCLKNKVPPISKAAAAMYPGMKQLSATAKLNGKLKGYTGHKLSDSEHKQLSDIILKLRKV